MKSTKIVEILLDFPKMIGFHGRKNSSHLGDELMIDPIGVQFVFPDTLKFPKTQGDFPGSSDSLDYNRILPSAK